MLNKFISEIAVEMKAYEEKAYLNDSKIENIKELMETMKKNKKIIESLTDMNSSLISKPIELQNQLEETFEYIPDNIRLNQNQSMMSIFSPFNLTATSLNSTAISSTSSLPVLDDYFFNDYEQFKSKIKPNKIQEFNSNDQHSKNISSLIEHLNHPEYKSKHNILNEVLKVLNYIKKEAIDGLEVCYNDDEQIINDIKKIENSLQKCEETDKAIVQKYKNSINKKIELCNKWLNNKDEVI